VRLLIPSNILGSHQHYFHLLLGNLVPLLGTPAARRMLGDLVFPDAGPLSPLLAPYGVKVVPFQEFKALALERGLPQTIFKLNRFGREVLDREALENHRLQFNTISPVHLRLFPHDRPHLYELGLREVATEALRLHEQLLAKAATAPPPPPPVLFVYRKSQHGFYADSNPLCDMPTGGAARRSIPNAGELVAALSKLGAVASVSLEGLPLIEQVRLFSSARLIVAQHGAALANLVFCRPGTRVLKIFPADSWNCFQPLAETFQVEYHRLTTAGPHDPVDVDAFLRIVASLL
jgi:hypothetical protein